jgi:hypothetical protein
VNGRQYNTESYALAILQILQVRDFPPTR